MDKRELADHYITEVQKELPLPMYSTTALTLALIRACEDLLICRDTHERYKQRIARERREDLAFNLGIPTPDLEDVLRKSLRMVEAAREPQNRAEAGHTHLGTDPLAPSGDEQGDRASLDPDAWSSLVQDAADELVAEMEKRRFPEGSPIMSLVACPNCDNSEAELYEVVVTIRGEWLKKVTIHCPLCEYTEER